MSKFYLGQSSLDVYKAILRDYSDVYTIKLIAHEVGVNWRQSHPTILDKLENVVSAFQHSKPLQELEYTKDEFSQLSFNDLPILKENLVWSISSKVTFYDKSTKHIAMMNLHPEEGFQLEDVKKVLRHIYSNKNGVLLDSGRFHHYYGDYLMEEDEWLKFIAQFLMPTVLVSPRYIGYRLMDGYCTLRLTADNKYKTKIPRVIGVL